MEKAPLPPHLIKFFAIESAATAALFVGVLDRFAGFEVFDQPQLGWAAIVIGVMLSGLAAVVLVRGKRAAASSLGAPSAHTSEPQPGLHSRK